MARGNYGSCVLTHVRQGSGEPLVLVHGIGSQWQVWSPVLERLGLDRDVVALDLPGFGGSAPLAGEVTLTALAGAVWELVQALGMERPHVAGNSLGGAVALELARTGRARTATGLSPLGFARGREIAFARRSLICSRALARALAPATGALLATGAGRTLLLSQFFARPWRVPPGDAALATRNLATSPGFQATLPLLATVAPRHLAVPVTIAWGVRDRLLIARQGRRARAAMPGATHLWLEGCGHVPTWDDPERVAEVLLAGSRG
jgi:pimeloyl-ACP methyl ester carboxylesterase